MESLEERVARLEQQVAYLQRRLGIDPAGVDPVSGAPRLPPQFYQELQRGKLIRAIKIYRESTGASLADAKRAVELMARQAKAIE